MATNGPSLAGVNFSQYGQWPTVNIDGLVYYQVPGNPGVVYDPRMNKWFYDQREAAKRKQEEAIKAQTPSIGQQLIPVAGGTAGTVLGAVGISHLAGGSGAAAGGAGGALGAATPGVAAGTAGAGSAAAGGAGAASGGILGSGGAAAAPEIVSGSFVPEAGIAAAPAEAGFLAGTALPVAGAAYAGYRGYKAYENLKDKPAQFHYGVEEALKPANIPLAIGTMGLSVLGGGLLSKAIGSGKGGGQIQRDKWRKSMQQVGFMDQNFQGTAADGSVIDWNNVNGDQGSGVKNMHFEDPTVGAAVAYADMLATAMGATGTARQNIAGELAKGALYNAGGDRTVVEDNMRHFAGLLGLDYNTINQNIDAVAEKNKSEKDQTTFATNKAAAGMLFGGSQPQPTQGSMPQRSGGVLQMTGNPSDRVREALRTVNTRRR